MIMRSAIALVLCLISAANLLAANPVGSAVKEAAMFIFNKFGGRTLKEVTEATALIVAKHGEDALPLLRRSGPAGFKALQEAGENAPDVIKLFARKGDEAIWIISKPEKLAIFIKHGDSAADALLKHPAIADSLIGKYGDEAVGALNSVSREGAQRLKMVADDGILAAAPQSQELLPVIREYGDEAMDFIWKNKGALATASVLATFLADPQIYISGAKELIIDPIAGPIVKGTNWTLIIAGILFVVFLPFIAKSISKARSGFKNKGQPT